MQILLPALFEVLGWMLGDRAAASVRRASLPVRIALAAGIVVGALALAVAATLAVAALASLVAGLAKSA